MASARSVAAFDSAWSTFQEKFGGAPVAYVLKNWIPDRHRCVRSLKPNLDFELYFTCCG